MLCLLVANILIFSVMAQNNQNVSLSEASLDGSGIPSVADQNFSKTLLGEAALGGMIPTSFIIVLLAILRILQIYKQKQQQKKQERTYKITNL